MWTALEVASAIFLLEPFCSATGERRQSRPIPLGQVDRLEFFDITAQLQHGIQWLEGRLSRHS